MSNDTDPKILIAPPGAVGEDDRESLRELGVVVIETDEPERCRFLQASQALSSTDMLWAAMDALREDFGSYDRGNKQRERLAENIASLIISDFERRPGVETLRNDE